MGADGTFSQMLMHRKEMGTHDEAESLKEYRMCRCPERTSGDSLGLGNTYHFV